MNRRESNILNDVTSGQKNVKISALAKKYDVTERTIRYDINVINQTLKLKKLPMFEICSGGYVTYSGDRLSIINLIKSDDFYNYKLSKEERRIAIALDLLLATDYITLAAISDKLFVSKTTLAGDLESVKILIKKSGMEIDSHPNKGLMALGPEVNRRFCILDIILTKIGLTKIVSNGCNPFYNMIISSINRNEGDKELIGQIIRTVEQRNNLNFTDALFFLIFCYLIIAVGRMKAGKYAEEPPKGQNSQSNFEVAKDILAYITDYFNIPLKNSEIVLLSEIFKKIGLASKSSGQSAHNDVVRVQVITIEFIHRVSDDLQCNLNSDYTFYKSLEKHLQSALLKNLTVPDNSVKGLIQNKYPHVMEIVKSEVPLLESFVKHALSDNEIYYIAIHICAAIERKKSHMKHVRVVVVCSGGIGTSELLSERLKSRFNFEIAGIVAAHNADRLEGYKADLIISTVPLKQHFNYILVRPFIDDQDYLKICRSLDSIPDREMLDNPSEKYHADDLLNIITPILDECPLDLKNRKILKNKLNYAVHSYFGNSKSASKNLYQLLTPDKIELGVSCRDSREAIKKSADILLRKGYIDSNYIEAIFRNYDENGPYFVISKGFAIPHAEIGSGTKKMGMSLIRLSRPVNFGVEELDPVEFVCCLSAVDSESHLKAFFNLVNLLREDNFKGQLKKAANPEEFAGIIKKYECLINTIQ